MVTSRWNAAQYVIILICAATCVLASLAGCNKSNSSGTGTKETLIEFGGTDVNPDGTLSSGTLQAIQDKSKEEALSIGFIRTRLSDAGLAQLAKFPNIRRITAGGSAITQAGIDKLKLAIPSVEVSK